MKITAFLICAFCIHVSASTLAQTVTLSEHKASLKKVINDIKQQTGYSFFYNEDWLQQAKPVDLNVKNEPLDKVLKICFADQPFDFAVVNQTIVLKLKEAPVASPNVQPAAQPVTVTGKVQDELGNPIAGVTVKQKDNSNNGTVTDAKGNYSLSLPDNNSVVSFSYVGYETQELAAKNIPAGSVVTLKVAENNLHEVVINKGYYNEKRELSTGNVDIVTAKTIEEQPVSDPIQALIGQVPGLNIQQTSGIPGAYATIHINGLNSISNGNDPLYVVDGVPFSSVTLSSPNMAAGAFGPTPSQNTYSNGTGASPFSALNPQDIEDIEILKDADATAIYGSRGANGVILITTKKGKAGAAKFALDANQGVGQVGHFMDLMNTQQYMKMREQGYRNDGVGVYPSNAYDVNGVWDTTRYTNWQKVLIGNNAQWTNINGELSGGNANTQFLIGAGYNRQTTVFPGDYADKKAEAHISITHTSDNQKFHAQLTASYVNDNDIIPTVDFTSAIILAPDAPALRNPDGSINWAIYNGTATFGGNGSSIPGNPLGKALQSSTSATNNLVSSLDLSYRLAPGLVLKSDFGYNHDEMNENYFVPDGSFQPPLNTNPGNRSITFANNVNESWIIEPQLSYTQKMGQGTLDALVGTSFQQQESQSMANFASGFASDALITNPQAATSYQLQGDTYALFRYNAIYARIGFNWKEKYLINITARRDGSSRFGPDRQWGNFGAVGAGWIFSKEKWVSDNLPWLNFGKLRVSYGITGNDQIGNYQYLSSYSSRSGTYQGDAQLVPTLLPNPDFRWEIDKKFQVGADLGFLKDRIDLSLDYYRNRSSNQLISEPIPYVAGFNNIEENFPATVQNTGLEVELHTVNIKEKDFTWSTNINFTLPKNELVAFPGIAQSPFYNSYIIGQPITIRRVWDYTGVNLQTGLYTFATQSVNGSLKALQDQVFVNPTQKFYGGIQNSFNYKKFSLDFFIQFVKQTIPNYQEYFTVPGNPLFNVPAADLSAWNAPGQITNVQRIYGSNLNVNNANNTFKSSTGVYTDGSFLRLKNVALSYRLPANWQNWAGMHNAKVYLQGQNLYTFTKYLGLDPETYGLVLPPLRMITAGIHTEF